MSMAGDFLQNVHDGRCSSEWPWRETFFRMSVMGDVLQNGLARRCSSEWPCLETLFQMTTTGFITTLPYDFSSERTGQEMTLA